MAIDFSVEIHDAEEGGYWAEVPGIPGCVTQGDDVAELEANLAEAMELVLECIVEDYAKSISPLVEIPKGDYTWTMSLTLQRKGA